MEDIVIVGAGPTGLALAAELTRRGVCVRIFDRLSAGENTSRAAVVHARTLETLEAVGATPLLLSEGVVVPKFRVRDRDRLLATIDFTRLQTSYPFTLMCPQNRMEAILDERLRHFGGAVVRPAQVTAICPSDESVRVEVEMLNKPTQTFHTRWLVAADGGRSTLRTQADIPFLGGGYDEDFVLADVRMNWPLERTEVDLFFSEDGLVVVAPLPDGQFRIVATVDSAPEHPETELFEQILRERGPQGKPIVIKEVIWASRFRLQHKVAASLRKGRVLLVGDAAHVHSPAGGQGMNTGIQDAVTLAEALIQASQHGQEGAIDEWEQKRRSVAEDVVRFTDRMTRAATLEALPARIARNLAIWTLGGLPFAQHALAERLSELVYR